MGRIGRHYGVYIVCLTSYMSIWNRVQYPERSKTWQVSRDTTILIVSVGVFVAVFNHAMTAMVGSHIVSPST